MRALREVPMVHWAIACMVLALVTVLATFGAFVAESAGTTLMLFYLFLLVFLVTLVLGLASENRTSSERD